MSPDLCNDPQLAQESESAEAQGIHYGSFPIPDRGAPAGRRAFRDDSGWIAGDHRDERRPAANLVSEARGREIPETAEQFEWIRRLPS
jgi:hypothetical protein